MNAHHPQQSAPRLAALLQTRERCADANPEHCILLCFTWNLPARKHTTWVTHPSQGLLRKHPERDSLVINTAESCVQGWNTETQGRAMSPASHRKLRSCYCPEA